MSDPHWEKVKDIFQTALEKPAGAERERYLNEACGADESLRGEVSNLLASFEESEDFLDEPAISELAEMITGNCESLSPEQQIGRYRIERKLGSGGGGEVFLARDGDLERLVALKVLSADFSADSYHARRFAQEARVASALNHPNIMTIYESGQIDSVRFIAAEYVEGETLRERLRRAPLDAGEILEIFAQTAAALAAAHRAGIVHHDIKPENIMIRADGLVKVLDFGLAKLVGKDSAARTEFKAAPGFVMGTVAYMSPEQARGLPTDERTDVWSLGVCLSESVFGGQPFTGETVSDRIAAILDGEPEPHAGNAPPELRRIIEKCLEKTVEYRYQTVSDFLIDLNKLRQMPEFSHKNESSFAQTETLSASGRQTGEPAVFSSSEISSAPTIAAGAKYPARGIKRYKFQMTAAAIVAAALALVLYFVVFKSFSAAEPVHSVAVLPFVNESGDADGEYLSDGLSESLIYRLSQLPQLKVASRSSAFQYKNKPADAREIARALGVETIVSGRVARRGDDLQISVELINAAENSQMWGETYRRTSADAQTIEREIARAVAKKLQIHPSRIESQSFSSPVTSNGQAYQLYMNGVFYRRKNGPENVRKAIEYQNQAVALDPNFALAYAELGANYYNLVDDGVIDAQAGLPPAYRAIEKALILNDSLAEAHDINARLNAAEYDWTGAETEVRRAIELNPNLASAHTFYSKLLTRTKRFDEALSEIRKARSLDPLRINLVNYEAEIFFRARRYADAQATFDGGNPEATNETFALICRARVAAAKNRYPEAIALLHKSLGKDETTKGLIHLGRIYALAGEREKALTVLNRLEDIERLKEADKLVSPAELAVFYVALGKPELAVESLERAFAERDPLLPWINVEPEYDALRGDARFSDLLRQIGLAP